MAGGEDGNYPGLAWLVLLGEADEGTSRGDNC